MPELSSGFFLFLRSAMSLLHEIRQCTLCADHLPLGPKPILTGNKKSKIAIVSQAPGKIANGWGLMK